MTRYEKIKKMNVKELADFLVEEIDCDICTNREVAEEWLEQEADDGEE